MTFPLTDSLPQLAELIGPLPAGDTPAAWWYSTAPQVLDAYAEFEADHARWRRRVGRLYKISGLRPRDQAPQRLATLGSDTLLGLHPPPKMVDPPRWWRVNNKGIMVPRRYTVMEKNSEVNKMFKRCQQIPRAVDYLPGLQDTLFIPTPDGGPTHAYPVQARRPGIAVLAFVGHPIEAAAPPFDPDPTLWTMLKLSTWHMLRERQSVTTQLEKLPAAEIPCGTP